MLCVLGALLCVPGGVSTAQALEVQPGPSAAQVVLQLRPVPSDFSHYEGEWLSIDYHPSLSGQLGHLLEVAGESRRELSGLFGRPVLRRVNVRIGRTFGEMEQLAPVGARLPAYAAGVAFSEQGLVLLSSLPRHGGVRHELGEVLRHELAHVALSDAVGRGRVPRWFNEGLAVHTSGEAETARLQALWTATVAERLLPLKELTERFPDDSDEASVAYAQAADLIRFLLRGGEEHRFRDLLARITGGQAFEAALGDAYSTNLFGLERDWKKDVARRYSFWPVLFGGSLIWVLGLGLLIGGYFKRRERAGRTMARWAREEAAEDVRRDLALEVLRRGGPVQVVLEPASTASLPSLLTVPRVEHDGDWHTLH